MEVWGSEKELEKWIWETQKLCVTECGKGKGGLRNERRELYRVPIVKRKKGERVREYRGVILMPTIYKIYTSALTERLREEMEGKGLIPPNQTGIKRRMGTTDSIYVLNYI